MLRIAATVLLIVAWHFPTTFFVPAGSPYGATYVGQPTDDDLAVAQHQGRRVATVAEWVRHAKSHAHGHKH